jgi:hypothetical protein
MTHCTGLNYRRRNEYRRRVQYAIDHHRAGSPESEDEPESVPVSPAPAAPAVLDAQCPTPEASPSPPPPDQRAPSPTHATETTAPSPEALTTSAGPPLGLLYDPSLGVFVAAATAPCSPVPAQVPITDTLVPISDGALPALSPQLSHVPYVPSPEPVFTALAPAPRARALSGDPLLPSLRFSLAGDIRATEGTSPLLGLAYAASFHDGLTDDDAIGDDDSQLGQMDTGGYPEDVPAVASNEDALFNMARLSPLGESLDIDFAFAPPSNYTLTTSSSREPISYSQEVASASAAATADRGHGESLFGRLVRRRVPSTVPPGAPALLEAADRADVQAPALHYALDDDVEDGGEAKRAAARRRLN